MHDDINFRFRIIMYGDEFQVTQRYLTDWFNEHGSSDLWFKGLKTWNHVLSSFEQDFCSGDLKS